MRRTVRGTGRTRRKTASSPNTSAAMPQPGQQDTPPRSTTKTISLRSRMPVVLAPLAPSACRTPA
ncbi:hypothetical protein BTHE_1966 [Bifidobacterium thermophilum]|nr:hypothetical protein BTHE_1966 [Bifidobacterium thermophilum]